MANTDTDVLLDQIIKTDHTDNDTYNAHLKGERVVFKDNDLWVKAQSFYNYLKNYFSKKMFIIESDNHPDTANNNNGNDNIIIWNDTGFQARFDQYLIDNEIDTTDDNYDEEAALAVFEAIDNQEN